MNPIKKIKYLYNYKDSTVLKEGSMYDLPDFGMVDLEEDAPQNQATGQTKQTSQPQQQQQKQKQSPQKTQQSPQDSSYNEKIQSLIKKIEQIKTNVGDKLSKLENKFEVTNQNIVSLKDMLYNPQKKQKEDMENRVNKGYSTVRDYYKNQKEELKQQDNVQRFDYSEFDNYDPQEVESDFFGDLKYDY